MESKPVRLLSADEILAAPDLAFEDVPVPEWGGTVRIQALPADEAAELIELLNTPEGKKLGPVRVLAQSAVDDKGARLFTQAQVEALKKKSMRVFLRLQKTAMDINGFNDVKEAGKNG